MSLEGIENIVSIYQITKMAHEGKEQKSEFEREIEYQKWVKNKQEVEQKIMDEMNNEIEKALIKNMKRWEEQNKNQHRSNYIDLPAKIYQWNNGELFLYPDTDEGDCYEQIVYSLHLATDPSTGKLSIQYACEDNHFFLSHKQIVKVIKMQNSIGKYGR